MSHIGLAAPTNLFNEAFFFYIFFLLVRRFRFERRTVG